MQIFGHVKFHQLVKKETGKARGRVESVATQVQCRSKRDCTFGRTL